jgi:hypothetical protein
VPVQLFLTAASAEQSAPIRSSRGVSTRPHLSYYLTEHLLRGSEAVSESQDFQSTLTRNLPRRPVRSCELNLELTQNALHLKPLPSGRATSRTSNQVFWWFYTKYRYLGVYLSDYPSRAGLTWPPQLVLWSEVHWDPDAHLVQDGVEQVVSTRCSSSSSDDAC